jgi:hypothetical protein
MSRPICCYGLLLALTALTFAATAAPKGAEPPKPQKPAKVPTDRVGVVLKVEPAQLTVKTYGKVSSELVIPLDAKTQVQVEGNPATVAEIKPGMEVVVSPASGTAQKVMAHKDGKKKKKDRDKKSPGTAPADK